MAGCYQINIYAFQDGTFSYTGEKVRFTEEIFLEEFVFEIAEITKTEYSESNGKNVIKNRLDYKTYSMDVYIKFDFDDELKHYDIKYLGIASIRDTYKIEINLECKNLFSGTLTLRLMFCGKIGDKTQIGKRCKLKILESQIKDVENNDIKIIGVPYELEYYEKDITHEEETSNKIVPLNRDFFVYLITE